MSNKYFIRLVICIGSLVFMANATKGQGNIDSLYAIIQSDVPDTTKFYPYSQVIWDKSRKDNQLAQQLARDLMTSAKKVNDEVWIHKAHFYLGVTLKNGGNLDEAFAHMDSAYQYNLKSMDTLGIADMAYQMGVIQKLKGEYESSLKYFNQTIEYYGYEDNQRMIGMTLDAKSGVYRILKLYNKAIENYTQALSIQSQRQDTTQLAIVHTNLGNVYAEMDSTELALFHFQSGEQFFRAANHLFGLSIALENMGKLYNSQGKYKQAITLLIKSVNAAKQMQSESRLVNPLLQLGLSYQLAGEHDKALKPILEGMEIAQKFNLTQSIQRGNEALSKYYARKGKYAQAYEHQMASQQIKDSLLNETIAEQSLKIDALTDYEKLQKQQEIELLSAQNEINALKLAKAQRNLLLAILGVLTLSILLYVIYRNRRKVQLLNRELTAQKATIAKSLEEKEFLLKEIHHRVKNNLQVISSLLKLQSKSVDDRSAQRALNEGRSRVRSMALIHQNLYQDRSNLAGIRMKEYLEQLIKELIDTYNISLENIQIQMNIEDLILDVDTAIPIGLIINELISNSLKYGFSGKDHGQISVLLREDPGQLMLRVKDNGVGFSESESQQTGFGSRLIQAFANRLQAQYTFNGNAGTESTLVIPHLRQAG